jgi:hypothetical protein
MHLDLFDVEKKVLKGTDWVSMGLTRDLEPIIFPDLWKSGPATKY